MEYKVGCTKAYVRDRSLYYYIVIMNIGNSLTDHFICIELEFNWYQQNAISIIVYSATLESMHVSLS